MTRTAVGVASRVVWRGQLVWADLSPGEFLDHDGVFLGCAVLKDLVAAVTESRGLCSAQGIDQSFGLSLM